MKHVFFLYSMSDGFVLYVIVIGLTVNVSILCYGLCFKFNIIESLFIGCIPPVVKILNTCLQSI